MSKQSKSVGLTRRSFVMSATAAAVIGQFGREAAHAETALDLERVAALDVSVAGLRMRRIDAEGRQPAIARQRRSARYSDGEGLGVENEVIGGKHEHGRVATEGSLGVERA